MGPIHSYTRKSEGRRDRGRCLRSIPSVSAGHRTGQTPQPEEPTFFHLMATHSACRDRRPEHEGDRSLQVRLAKFAKIELRQDAF